MATTNKTTKPNTAAVNPDKLTDGGKWYSEPYVVKLGDEFSTVEDQLKFKSNDYEGAEGGEKNALQFYGLVGESSGKDLALANTVLKNPYYQDTRVGGNDAINCLWQFNRDDDIVHPVNVTTGDKNNFDSSGMGRVYAATTQFNQQICWFTFGIPYFTNLGRFYQTAFDPGLIGLNNNAIAGPGVKLGRIFGTIGTLYFSLCFLPIFVTAGLALFNRVGDVSKKYPVNRFYELRSTMQLYYDYVDSILAHWLVSAGLYNNGPSGHSSGADYVPDALTYTGASIWDILRRRAMTATRSSTDLTQGLTAYKAYGGDTLSEYYAEHDDSLHQIPGMYGKGSTSEASDELSFKEAAKYFQIDKETAGEEQARSSSIAFNKKIAMQKEVAKLNQESDEAEQSAENGGDKYAAAQKQYDIEQKTEKLESNYLDEFINKESTSIFSAEPKDWADSFLSSALGASEFIGFRITNSTDASESFSNSTQESAFARAYNEKVSSVMRVKNDLAQPGSSGQSSSEGIINKFFGAVAGFIGGAIDAFNAIDVFGITDLGQALMQGSWIDIPEQYSGSDFNKSHSLTLQLRSPYGDAVSIYQSIIVPLACLLAGTLPRGSGENSYTQPFLCRIYCKGMFAVPMGIIDSLSIKRGDSEFGWTYDNIPLCIDVSLSIKDMSPIMYLSFNTSTFNSLFTNDSTFNEYLRTLSGVGLFERISMFSRFRRNLQYAAQRAKNKIFNPSYYSYSVSQWNIVAGVTQLYPRTSISKK